jgi:uncharacterized membrane protein HdeD (DUF308 family)
MRRFSQLKLNALIIAILLCAVGTILVLVPDTGSTTICYIIAGCFIFLALYYFFRFFRSLKDPDYIGNELGAAIALLVVGVYMVLDVKRLINLVPVMLAFIIVSDSAIKLQNSFFLKKIKSERAGIIFFIGFINLLIAILLLWNPFFSKFTDLIIALSVGLLFSGVSDLVMLILVIKASKTVREENLIEEHIEKR